MSNKPTVLTQTVSEDYWFRKLRHKGVCALYNKLSPNGPKTIRTQAFNIPESVGEKISKVSGQDISSTFILLLAAYKVLLAKYSTETEFVIAGQLANEAEGTKSFFFHDVQRQMSFRNALKQSSQEFHEMLDFQNYDYKVVERKLTASGKNINELLKVGFACSDSQAPVSFPEAIELHIQITLKENKFSLAVTYQENAYDYWFVEQLIRHYLFVLVQLIENPDRTPDEIQLMNEEEISSVLTLSAGAEAPIPDTKTFLSYFKDQVSQRGNHLAVVCGTSQLTYQQVDELSDTIVRNLSVRRPATMGKQVAIVMERSEKMLCTIIATWKLRAAYIPVEPGLPMDRIVSMLGDVPPLFFIAESEQIISNLREQFPSSEILNIHDALAPEVDAGLPTGQPVPSDLAYVIFTSGSTGKPKGVMINHQGMLNHLFAKIEDLGITDESRVAQTASHSFDISVWQFFSALISGGTVIIYKDSEIMNPVEFIKSVQHDEIKIMEVVPSYLSVILEVTSTLPNGALPHLKYLIATGEILRPVLAKQWSQSFPNALLINAYGPTEASDDVTHHVLTDSDLHSLRIPIGKPIRNTFIYVVNEMMQLCPPGVKGEIVVGGAGVGDGYLNEPELTARKFVKNCFPNNPFSTLYKTGDLGCYLPDGSVDFFGRKDYQVKIKGFRVELNEIENLISQITSVTNVVVTFYEKENIQALVAYLVLKNRSENDLTEIKEYLVQRLPAYMVPAEWVVMTKFPETASGKVDRNALPQPTKISFDESRVDVPTNEVERKLQSIWEDVFKISPIGIHDNFFKLGGDSIKGIRIVNRIQAWLEEVVHVTVLFTSPTIAELAKLLESYKNIREEEISTEKINFLRSKIPAMAPWKTKGPKNPRAIFILSPPRSGSTLLRIIMAGHPELFAPQEMELLTFNTLQERKDFLDGKFSFYLEGVVRAVMEAKGCTADEAKSMLEEFEKQGMDVKEFYGVLQNWIGDRFLVEKTPSYTLSLDTLNRAEEYFDEPLYIHLIRHPAAMIHSFMEAKLDQLFKYESPYNSRELAEMIWHISHANIESFLTGIPESRVIRVKYEDMVADPDRQISQLTAFLGLEFKKEMIKVYDKLESKMTTGIYDESKMLGDVKFFKHKEINTGSIENWKQSGKRYKLSGPVKKMAASLGYDLTENQSANEIPKLPVRDDYATSYHQNRLWVTQHIQGENAAYNILNAFSLEGPVNVRALKHAYETVLKRHDILRTTFFLKNDQELRQKVELFQESKHSVELQKAPLGISADSFIGEILEAESHFKFDLKNGPLIRCILIETAPERYLLICNMHHIISDAWSKRVLITEFIETYNQATDGNWITPPSDEIQYKDFAQFQNDRMKAIEQRLYTYWEGRLKNNIPIVNLPVDYPRTKLTINARSLKFVIGNETYSKFAQLCTTNHTSLFVGLLSCYGMLLHAISRQDRVIIGTSLAGRVYPEVEKVLGFFINTVAMPVDIPKHGTYEDFLKAVGANAMSDIEHQEMPFDVLVKKLQLKRDTLIHPLFQVRLVYNNFADADQDDLQFNGVTSRPVIPDIPEAKFDISITVGPGNNALIGSAEYNADLWEEETMEKIISGLTFLVECVSNDPHQQLAYYINTLLESNILPHNSGAQKLQSRKSDLFHHHFKK